MCKECQLLTFRGTILKTVWKSPSLISRCFLLAPGLLYQFRDILIFINAKYTPAVELNNENGLRARSCPGWSLVHRGCEHHTCKKRGTIFSFPSSKAGIQMQPLSSGLVENYHPSVWYYSWNLGMFILHTISSEVVKAALLTENGEGRNISNFEKGQANASEDIVSL